MKWDKRFKIDEKERKRKHLKTDSGLKDDLKTKEKKQVF